MGYRKATATKYGKIHIAGGNMTLCLQYAGTESEDIKETVNCKRCLAKAQKEGINLKSLESEGGEDEHR